MTVISVIVLVLALALAIPGLWRVRIHVRTRAQQFEAHKKAAWISLQTGSGGFPSWIRNEERLSAFLFTVQKLVLRKGVPHRKILAALASEHFFIRLISFAGALEIRDVTFAEQQLAVAEAIVQRFDYDESMSAEAEIFYSDCSATQSVDHTETNK